MNLKYTIERRHLDSAWERLFHNPQGYLVFNTREEAEAMLKGIEAFCKTDSYKVELRIAEIEPIKHISSNSTNNSVLYDFKKRRG